MCPDMDAFLLSSVGGPGQKNEWTLAGLLSDCFLWGLSLITVVILHLLCIISKFVEQARSDHGGHERGADCLS